MKKLTLVQAWNCLLQIYLKRIIVHIISLYIQAHSLIYSVLTIHKYTALQRALDLMYFSWEQVEPSHCCMWVRVSFSPTRFHFSRWHRLSHKTGEGLFKFDYREYHPLLWAFYPGHRLFSRTPAFQLKPPGLPSNPQRWAHDSNAMFI